MKKGIICVFISLLCLVFPANSNARGYNGHFGVAFPAGVFGEDGKHWGGAAAGYNAGFQYLWDFKLTGLNLFLGSDVIYNGLQDDTRNYWENSQHFDNSHKYFNFPVNAGFHYAFKLTRHFSLFGEAGMGPDFLKITNDKRDEDIRKFKLSAGMGYKAGGGLVFNDKYYLEVHYYGLGEHDVKYAWESADTENKIENIEIRLFTLTIGFHL